MHYATIQKYADVTELADVQDLGSCVFGVGVQVPSSAPKNKEFYENRAPYFLYAFEGLEP